MFTGFKGEKVEFQVHRNLVVYANSNRYQRPKKFKNETLAL